VAGLTLDAVIADNRVDMILYLKSMLVDGEHYNFYRNVVRKAVQAGNIDILVAIGAENCIDGFQGNIAIALYTGHISVVKFLLQCNQSRLFTYNLDSVIGGGSLEMLKFCVGELEYFDPQDHVIIALASSSVDILDYLIHNGAVISPDDLKHFIIYAPLDASSQVLPISSLTSFQSKQMLMLRYLYTHGHIYDLQTFICKYSHLDGVVRYFHSVGELKDCKKSVVSRALLAENYALLKHIS
tara:strand:+ start:25151 stop:25873 length:723 start_codon:yes stop_codon:yes gene_type:complete